MFNSTTATTITTNTTTATTTEITTTTTSGANKTIKSATSFQQFCDPDWIYFPHTKNCYKYFASRLNQEEASSSCSETGVFAS